VICSPENCIRNTYFTSVDRAPHIKTVECRVITPGRSNRREVGLEEVDNQAFVRGRGGSLLRVGDHRLRPHGIKLLVPAIVTPDIDFSVEGNLSTSQSRLVETSAC
jgi:hypothetical protein